MIPLCVRLKGFLCYKEEQEISFDGASLWMLSGLNGSGKSAVFDAVTYALFGHHRGGSQQAQELINKNTEGLEVEFDFLQEGKCYRIRRTVKRSARGGTTGTQQIFERVSHNGNGQPKWEGLKDTQKRVSFDEWVSNNIGLSYETFTSSVLLLQGKAEKLLDSTAKGRFEVLAGIVDLDRYQRLHQRADDERRAQDLIVKELRDKMAAIPEVSAAELLAADVLVQDREKARVQAAQEVERLQQLEFQARRWEETRQQLDQTRHKLRQTEALLVDAADIERDEQRLRELQAVLPAVQTAMEQKRGIEAAERQITRLGEQQQKTEQDLARQEDELQKARLKRKNLEDALQQDERRLREVTTKLRSVTAQLEKLKEYERLQQQLTPLQEEIKKLPANPSADVKKAGEVREQLNELAQAVPPLARLVDVRVELQAAVSREKEAAAERQKVEARGKKLKAEVEQLKADVTEAAQVRQQADEQATATRTLRDQTRQQLQDLLQVSGAKICRHCGQELTAKHVQEEKVRRDRELTQAEKEYQQALQRQQTAQAREKQAHTQLDTAEQHRQQAREDFRTCVHEAEQASKDVQRLRAECGRIYEDLPEVFRQRISPAAPEDWLQPAFPAADDVADLRRQARGLEAARQRMRDAETLLHKWNRLKGEETTLLQGLHRMQAELPRDHQVLRETHASLEAEEKGLQKEMDARRKTLEDNQKATDRSTRERDRVQQDLIRCKAEIQTQAATQKNGQQILARALKELPDSWKETVQSGGLSDLTGWVLERDDLVTRQTEQRARELQQARLSFADVKRVCAELDERLAQFPEEVHQGPEAIQQRLQQTRGQYRQCDEDLNKARQKFALLENQQSQREQFQQQCLEADGKLAHWKLLADLLGRDRLQLHLVRQAERQVVDHANSVLDRLSGGELYLRLCGEAGGEGNAAKALELEAHNRITGEKPINVAFLSGSQKFRVAVSLALGIGQYASRQHRPIESVIIDEGFGCLDRNARQVMIQELQNLRSQMRCILLVSHQEEFADAFTDGYHFELANGSTVARRFQR